MTTDRPTSPDAPRESAAYWFARVHSGAFTPAEREHFQRWREADPAHEREYRALEEIWQTARLLPAEDVRELLAAPEAGAAARSHGVARRRWLVGAGVAGAAAIVGGVALGRHALEAPLHVARYVTARGERRSEALPDGSRIQINVASELVVRYYAARRTVDLLGGEASFEVTPDAARPFLVDAGAVSVRVTGTVFNVRREADRVAVAVQSGTVEVSSGRWWQRERARLTAGELARSDAGHALSVAPADVTAVTAWRQGKVVFEDQPLEDMVREMNRYLSRPIHLSDSRLKRLRMAGVFSIDDGEGFLQALQNSLPIAVRRRPDGSADLSLLH